MPYTETKKIAEALDTTSKYALILAAILAVTLIVFYIVRHHRNKTARPPAYGRTAFAGSCFGIIYRATDDTPTHASVFDKNGNLICDIPEEESLFLGLIEEQNQLILYTETNGVTEKFVFDMDQGAFVKL